MVQSHIGQSPKHLCGMYITVRLWHSSRNLLKQAVGGGGGAGGRIDAGGGGGGGGGSGGGGGIWAGYLRMLEQSPVCLSILAQSCMLLFVIT